MQRIQNLDQTSVEGGQRGGRKKLTTQDLKELEEKRKQVIEKLKIEALTYDQSGSYGENCVNLLKFSQPTKPQLESMLTKQSLIVKTRNQYELDDKWDAPHRIDPLCGDDGADGYDIDHINEEYVFKAAEQFDIPGPMISRKGIFRCDGKENITINEVMVNWLSAYIKKHDLCATPLLKKCVDQRGLANNGKGATVVTINRHTQDLLQDLPELRKGNVPILAITRFDRQGLHFGSEESYYCDGKYIKGCRPGSGIYYDVVDPFPRYGMYGEYVVETLVTFGNYRVVLLSPGYTDTHVELSSPGVCFLQTPTIGISKKEVVPRENHIGLWRWKEVVAKRKNIAYTYDWTANLGQMAKPNFWQKFAHFLKCPKDYKAEIAVSTALVISTLGVAVTPWALGGWLLAPSCYKTYDWFKSKLDLKEISLALAPVQFDCGKGKEHLTEEIIEHYIKNPIDTTTGLPYGFYNVTPYSITQYPQGHPEVNYHNMCEFFKHFCSSRNKGMQVWPDLMNLAVPKIGNTIIRAEDWQATFKPVHDIVPTVISSRVPFKVNIKDEKEVVHTCLSGKEELRKYLMGKMGPRTIAAILSRRVVRGGISCLLDKEELLKEWIEAWLSKSQKKFYNRGAWKPDYEKYKNMSKKYKRYDRAWVHKGPWWTESVYRLFEKLECLAIETIEKKGGRMISPNSPEMNLMIMDFCHDFEVELYSWVDDRDGLRIFAKGLNYDQRQELIRNVIIKGHWQYCIPIDCKNFDGHVIDKVAIVELLFFSWLGMEEECVKLLLSSRITGIATYDLATRKSGDMFTGSGNCMIMYMLLYKFFRKGLRIICDGDDTLLFLNDLKLFDEINKNFELHGFELGPVEAISIKWFGSPQYVIPFCQMYYSYHVYDLDHNRMKNKLFNIVTSRNPRAIAEKIVGKLQAAPVLKNMGYVFDIDPSQFFTDFEKSYWQEVKEEYSKGTVNLDRSNAHTICFRDPDAGLIGKIVIALDAMKRKYKKKTTAEGRRRLVLSTIESIVAKELKKEEEADPLRMRVFEELKSYIDLRGVKAFLPFYVDQLTRKIANYYGYKLSEVPFEVVEMTHVAVDSITVHSYDNLKGYTEHDIESVNDRHSGDGNTRHDLVEAIGKGIKAMDLKPQYYCDATTQVTEVDATSTISSCSNATDYMKWKLYDGDISSTPSSPVYRPVSPKMNIVAMVAEMHYDFEHETVPNLGTAPMSVDEDLMSVDENEDTMDVDQLTMPVRCCRSPEPMCADDLFVELMAHSPTVPNRLSQLRSMAARRQEENMLIDDFVRPFQWHIAFQEELRRQAARFRLRIDRSLSSRNLDYDHYITLQQNKIISNSDLG